MMDASRLDAFPFLAQQQDVVAPLLAAYPSLQQYDVAADWLVFNNQHAVSDIFQKLRLFRQSRLAYIAQCDFVEATEHHGLAMLRTSQLADHLLHLALESAYQGLVSRFGQVVDESGGRVPFAVLALGKLGTNELNYSSDVDLVFVCGGDGVSDGPRSLDATRYFERLGRQLIKLLDQFTATGRVYRVDMRLRPFGSAAPLVCTATALQHYIIT